YDCPEEAGLAKFNGCPDTDEDGVQDSKDKCPNTPKGCPVDADGCPLDSDGDGVIDCEDKCPTVEGPASNNGCPDWSEIKLSAILFELNKAILSDEGKAELDKLAQTLNASKEYDLVIGGHACNVGTEDYNLKLSEKRAQAVVKYLLSKGVNNAYVGSNNWGESKPAVENNSRSNRKLNRRAEFEVAKIRK
ncbi:MAG: OmpA family protein, partial [Bacteroidetes bacterium]|nr:OmpA family protein [Bacteroidota bacterium]